MMKRLGVLITLTFLLWGVVPAGANTVADVALNCDGVTFSWSAFSQRPTDLRVHVTQGDTVTDATVSTDGEPSGSGSVSVDFADGPASASVSWTNQKEHTVTATADLHCSVTTTTESTTTTVPETTTSSPTTAPPVTTPPEQCGPDTLACTGSSTTPLAVGSVLLLCGAALLAFTRGHVNARRRAR